MLNGRFLYLYGLEGEPPPTTFQEFLGLSLLVGSRLLRFFCDSDDDLRIVKRDSTLFGRRFQFLYLKLRSRCVCKSFSGKQVTSCSSKGETSRSLHGHVQSFTLPTRCVVCLRPHLVSLSLHKLDVLSRLTYGRDVSRRNVRLCVYPLICSK